jgi:hypothetical protein
LVGLSHLLSSSATCTLKYFTPLASCFYCCVSIRWCPGTFDEWCEQRCLCGHNFVENYRGTSIAHEHYILRFSVLKNDHSLFAIGGPWNAAFDGGDPSLDCPCLIRSAIMYVLIKQYIMDYSYNGDVTFIQLEQICHGNSSS